MDARTHVATARPDVTAFHDARTGTVQYVLADPTTGRCAVIDPVLDYDEKSGSIATRSADAILGHVRRHGLAVEWVLDTHPHADHLSAAHYLRTLTGARTGIGERIVEVQELWKPIYDLPQSFATDGSQWDRLFKDGERFTVGSLEVGVLFSPGHTLCSVTYVCGDAAFVHDTVFMPDSGTARADFPGGDAGRLWDSIERILSLPAQTRLFTGHDYRPGGREALWQSSVTAQRTMNIHLKGRSKADFVAWRTERDRGLPMPRLILAALQVNIRGGRLPSPQGGRRYLTIPLDVFPVAPWD